MKVSVDAVVFEEYNSTGVGITVKDCTGGLISARTMLIIEVLHPSLAEAIAIKEALSWQKLFLAFFTLMTFIFKKFILLQL